MKCCDHPKRNAVALLHQKDYSIAVCVTCLELYKRDMNDINKLNRSKPPSKSYEGIDCIYG